MVRITFDCSNGFTARMEIVNRLDRVAAAGTAIITGKGRAAHRYKVCDLPGWVRTARQENASEGKRAFLGTHLATARAEHPPDLVRRTKYP
jgi:hypothetical protein